MDEFRSGDRVTFNVLDEHGGVRHIVYGQGAIGQKVNVSRKVHGYSATLTKIEPYKKFLILDEPIRIGANMVDKVWIETGYYYDLPERMILLLQKGNKSLDYGDEVMFNAMFDKYGAYSDQRIVSKMIGEMKVTHVNRSGMVNVTGLTDSGRTHTLYDIPPVYLDKAINISLTDLLLSAE